MIHKAKHIKENNLYFDNDTNSIEDYPFVIQLNPYIKKTIFYENKIVYFYRLRENSMMGSKDHIVIPARLRASLICKEVIEGKRIGDVDSSYHLLYYSMSMVMSKVAKMDSKTRRNTVNHIKSSGLFPLRYNKKCTGYLKNDKGSFKKRLYNKLYSIAYTKFGFFCLVLWNLK